MSRIEVVGLGAMNMDYLCHVESILQDGEAAIKEFALSPGGSAANTVYGLAKLGHGAGFIGAVGDDENGQLLTRSLRHAGVDTSRIKVMRGANSGMVVALSDTLGRRSLYVLTGANCLLSLDATDVECVNQAELLHLSSFADSVQFDASIDLVRRLKPSVKISFAPGALYATLGLRNLASVLERTDILFLNRSEIQELTDLDVMAGAEVCLKSGVRTVVVTLGAGMEIQTGKGARRRTVNALSYIRDSRREYFIEGNVSNEMKLVEATGAGDAFAAGFLHGWLSKKDWQTCGLLGDLAARFSMRKLGAREGLPTVGQLSRRYQSLYKEKP